MFGRVLWLGFGCAGRGWGLVVAFSSLGVIGWRLGIEATGLGGV